MIAALLFALGIADWLTTRAILAHGGYERNPVAKAGIARFGLAGFMLPKAIAMGLVGWFFPWWMGAIVGVAYAAVMVNNVAVLRRL